MIGRLQAPGDDEDEEEMLRRAIAMSLEVETEEKESFSIRGEFSLEMSWATQTRKQMITAAFCFSDDEMVPNLPPANHDEEEEMLKRAIAMSLEEQ